MNAMENFRKTCAEELKNLEIKEEEEITAKLLSTKFKLKAIKVHSDKTGLNDDKEFKNLLNDYNKCIEALRNIVNDNEDTEKIDIKEFFTKHNVSKENSNSWTILIEKKK
jgi:hypothetical protein